MGAHAYMWVWSLSLPGEDSLKQASRKSYPVIEQKYSSKDARNKS